MSLTLYQGSDTDPPAAPAPAPSRAPAPVIDPTRDNDPAGHVDLSLSALVGHVPSLGTEATLQIGDAPAAEEPAPIVVEPPAAPEPPPPLLLLGPGVRVANAATGEVTSSCHAAFGSVDALTLLHADPASASMNALMVLS